MPQAIKKNGAATNSGGGGSGLVIILQMIFCTAGIYAAFFYWSILQERIATQTYPMPISGGEKKFTYSFIISLFGSVSAAALSFAICLGRAALGFGGSSKQQSKKDGSSVNKMPWKELFLIGFTLCYGAPFGYAAMKYVSYPVVLTLKMCKMIPVVVVGILVHKTKYSLSKYISLVLVTAGVMGFMLLGERKQGKESSASSDLWTMLLGTLLCFINLTFDGYTNSTQDLVNKKYAHIFDNPFKLMMYSNFFASFVAVISLLCFEFVPVEYNNAVISRQLFEALSFIQEQPAVMVDLIQFGALAAIGQSFLFTGIALFGSLTVVAITVLRKIGSVCLSIYINNHSVSTLQLVALSSCCAGIVIDTIANIQNSKKNRAKKLK